MRKTLESVLYIITSDDRIVWIYFRLSQIQEAAARHVENFEWICLSPEYGIHPESIIISRQ